jgi:uracil-DNA glycosylase
MSRIKSSAWKPFFRQQEPILRDIFEQLKEDEKTYEIVPLKENIFKAFEITPPKDIRVCFLGMDPYYSISKYTGEPRATGLAFSVDRRDIIPPSLRNIFKEIKRTITDFTMPDNGDLTYWAEQGVFLLNSALTSRVGGSGAHLKIWRPFTRETLKYIHNTNPECIFCLWGSTAKGFQSALKDHDQNRILLASYPGTVTFIGCDHFTIIDEIMESDGQELIDWNLPE